MRHLHKSINELAREIIDDVVKKSSIPPGTVYVSDLEGCCYRCRTKTGFLVRENNEMA